MEKEREEKLAELEKVKEQASKDLKSQAGYESSVVQNVKGYDREIELTNKKTGEHKKFKVYTVEVYDYETDQVTTRVYLDGQEFDIGELQRDYEESIKDTLEGKLKEHNKEIEDLNQLKSEHDRDEYARVAGIDPKDVKRILEFDDTEEKEQEQEETVEQEVNEKKLETVSSLEEIKAETRVNNYQTLAKALNMQGVAKFVVVYSEDAARVAKNQDLNKSRNNSTYSFVAIKNDGTAINIDDKLKLSRSEGTNSTERRIQTNADGTTEKDYHQASIFHIKGTNKDLAIENGLYGEIQISYGSMTKGAYENEGNQFVGTQLETRSVWPTSREVREQEDYQRGEYNTDDKLKEANKHFNEHGEDKIKDIKNADGKEETVEECEHIGPDDLIPGTDTTWRQFADMCGYRGDGDIERAQKELENYKKDYPDVDNQQAIEEIEEKIENEMPGPNKGRS